MHMDHYFEQCRHISNELGEIAAQFDALGKDNYQGADRQEVERLWEKQRQLHQRFVELDAEYAELVTTELPWHRLDPNLVYATARHEIAHWLAYRDKNIITTGITLVLSKSRLGTACWITGMTTTIPYKSLRTQLDFVDYLKARIVGLYCGALAEAMEVNSIDFELAEEIWLSSGSSDSEKATELLAMLVGLEMQEDDNPLLQGDAFNYLQKGLKREAAILVNYRRPYIQLLSKKMGDAFLELKQEECRFSGSKLQGWVDEQNASTAAA